MNIQGDFFVALWHAECVCFVGGCTGGRASKETNGSVSVVEDMSYGMKKFLRDPVTAYSNGLLKAGRNADVGIGGMHIHMNMYRMCAVPGFFPC